MITFLSGGTGTPKLLSGMPHNADTVVIGNTGDDIEMGDLLVCPDLDTVMYLSSGILDRKKWWGIKGDTFDTHDYLVGLAKEKGWNGNPNFLKKDEQTNGKKIANWRRFSGGEEFMKIGDRDRLFHKLRSCLIEEGKTLTEVTENLCSVLKAGVKLLPMSDDPVSSILQTDLGEMHFQAFWTGWKGKPEVENIEFRGAETAKTTRFVVDALKNEVIIGPSNPVTSIGPILSLKGVEELLSETKVVAVSPFIGDKSFSGPIKKLMMTKGYEANTSGLMEMYPFVDVFVVDSNDKKRMNRPVVRTDIRIGCKADATRVYEACLKAFEKVEKK
tara:strand:- start:196 stop:1185 length:990 start_codon:yes stop_codon:yes gene_type:complete